MNDRTEFLKRWSELAPGECELELDCFHVGLSFDGWFFYRPDVMFNPMVRAVLLSALIEAIRARGWKFTLETGLLENDGYCADVSLGTGQPGDSTFSHAAEPCDALLGTYVNLLEIQKEY